MTFEHVRAPGGTLYMRCHVCRMRIGEEYADDGRIAVCLSCKPTQLPEETHADEAAAPSAP